MYRKLTGLVVLGVAALWAAGTGTAGEKGGGRPGAKRANYVHAVIFYLKKGAPAGEAEALIEDSHKLLAKIPSVRHLWVGRPAEKGTPKVGITDFQVGLLVLFDDYDGLKTYIDHPLHTQYVEKHEKYWQKVPVYDFVNAQK